MYFGDGKRDTIEMANLNGTDRVVVLNESSSDSQYAGLALDDQYVYFSDWSLSSSSRSAALNISITRCLHALYSRYNRLRWLGSRVVSVLDSGAVRPGFKSQPRRCRVTVLGKLFTSIVHLFTKQ